MKYVGFIEGLRSVEERGMFSFTFYVARCKYVLDTYGFQVKHLFSYLVIYWFCFFEQGLIV